MAKSETHTTRLGATLKFVTLDGNPTQAVTDSSIRKLVRSNATSSRSIGRHAADASAIQVDLSAGKSRFALASRKPMKRVRRRAASKVGGVEEEQGSVSAGRMVIASTQQEGLFLGLPGRIVIVPAYSLTYMEMATRSKVSTMTQYFFKQVLDMQHIPDLEDLFKCDQAIYHASLSIASAYYDTGANNLFHCSQALKIVAKRLSDRELQTNDETIGAVGLLIIHNTLTGTNENSDLHMNGLQQMVAARGGLHKLPTRLRQTLNMIDTFHATTWNCRPRFPFLQPDKDLITPFKASLSPKDLELLNAYRMTYKAWGMREVLEVLRLLTVIRYNDPLGVFNRLAICDAIYLLEYRLLSLGDVDPGSGFKGLFRIAAFIYIDRILRDMPPLNLNGLVSRLVGAMKIALNCGPAGFLDCRHLSILLWILFIGRVACRDVEERQLFLEELVHVCGLLEIRHRSDFWKRLDNVGPALQPFRIQCEETWAAIEELNDGGHCKCRNSERLY